MVEVSQSVAAVCIPVGKWAQESCRLPNQASSQAPPSTCSSGLRSRQSSFTTVNWTPPNVIAHTSCDILHSIICDLFKLFLLVFFLKDFSMGLWETFTFKGVLICLLCSYHIINSYCRNPLDRCRTDQPRTKQISLSASPIRKHVIYTHNLDKVTFNYEIYL